MGAVRLKLRCGEKMFGTRRASSLGWMSSRAQTSTRSKISVASGPNRFALLDVCKVNAIAR